MLHSLHLYSGSWRLLYEIFSEKSFTAIFISESEWKWKKTDIFEICLNRFEIFHHFIYENDNHFLLLILTKFNFVKSNLLQIEIKKSNNKCWEKITNSYQTKIIGFIIFKNDIHHLNNFI